jgi:hypothetical protein
LSPLSLDGPTGCQLARDANVGCNDSDKPGKIKEVVEGNHGSAGLKGYDKNEISLAIEIQTPC